MAQFNCTVIENNQEKVITVDSLWLIPENSVSVKHNTSADVGMFLHVRPRLRDLKRQTDEMEKLIDHLDDKLNDMEGYEIVGGIKF